MQRHTILLPFLAFFLLFSASGAFAQQKETHFLPQDQPLKAAVDTLCASWHVCLQDIRGINLVGLIDDTAGKIIKPPREFKNAMFDPAVDSTFSGQIIYTGKDSALCFDAFPQNPLDSAYSPIFISDVIGDVIVIDLFYPNQRIQRSVLPNLPKRVDTLTFTTTKIGDEICSTLVYINMVDPKAKNFSVSAINLKKNTGDFKISSTTPQLPAVIKPGDTLKIQVCYDPKKTGISHDSVLVVTDCYTSATMVTGFGVNPSIHATDAAFPQVEIDSISSQFVTIKNDGNLLYKLANSWKLSDTVNFYVDTLSASQLPKTLKPLDSAKLKIIFRPKSVAKDTARIDWVTDIDTKYILNGKKYSILTAEGIPDKVNSVNSMQIVSQKLSLIPNPASGNTLMCQFSLPVEGNGALTVFDASGKEVYSTAAQAGLSQIEIPIQNLSEGPYYVHYKSESVSLTQSFIKVK